MFVVPQFADLFRGFGADLPVETRVLLSTYPWWGALILPIVALWWYEWKNAKNQMTAVVFGAFAGGALLLFGVWACYSPLMRLAAIE
jgi:type II secretory pathway component PulF